MIGDIEEKGDPFRAPRLLAAPCTRPTDLARARSSWIFERSSESADGTGRLASYFEGTVIIFCPIARLVHARH